MRILIVLSLVIPVLSGQSTNRDRVLLKSGRALLGKIENASWEEVSVRDFELGSLTVSRDRVRALVRAGAAASIFDPRPPKLEEGTPPSSHLRYRRPRADAPGGLDTGVSRWRHQETGTTLFLVGAVHIAEMAYFRRLQEILDSTDVVLFEGVGRGPAGEEPSEEDLNRLDAVRKLQVMMKDMLHLEYQHDGIEYGRDFWKNADVDFAALSAEMKRLEVGLPTDNKLFRILIKLVFGLMNPEKAKKNKKLAMRLRRQMASVMGMSDRLMKRLGKLRTVLINFRNDAAMDALAKEVRYVPGRRWVSLFYGAAHLPDFAERLQKQGWVYEGLAWVPAWTVR